MNKSFSVLHLSDIHYDDDKEIFCPTLVDKLLEDLDILEKHNKLNIKFVVVTGDLVNYGNDKTLFGKAFDNIICPIIEKLNLDFDSFIYVPGNHEMDRSEADQDFQKAFVERISRNGVEKENFSNKSLTRKSDNFFNFIKQFYDWEQKDVILNIAKKIDEMKIGFSLYNTSWCSSTFSDNDVKKIMMPIGLAQNKSSALKGCDIKIALMHHPVDWYEDDNSFAIQNILSDYNIVLAGHKHKEVCKLEQKGPQKTLYNYGNKILPLNSKDCGYTIIQIERLENSIKLYHREYNEKINSFSKCILDKSQVYSDVEYTKYSIANKNDCLQIAFRIFKGFRKNFVKTLDKLFITNALDGIKDFNSLYVNVSLSNYPEYSKETKKDLDAEKDKTFEISDIIETEEVINIFGKKESGKTVLSNAIAKYYLENFENINKIPIVVDCKKAGLTNIDIDKYMFRFITDFIDDDTEFSKQDYKMLLQENRFVIILDDYDYLTQKQNKELEKLKINKVLVRDLDPLVFGEDDKLFIKNEITSKNINFYIRSYDKKEIRKLINNLTLTQDNDKYVNDIVSYFDSTCLPRTPFIISLIATICNKHRDTIPTNQARILEQFIENVLEKLNPNEQLTKTYDFNNKESFLSTFAYELYKSGHFYMTTKQFMDFTIAYHTQKGYALEDSRFDKIFFEKNILASEGGNIYFRFECFNYYYLAKYALKAPEFRDKIVMTDNIVKNAEVIAYYTGLKRDDKFVLDQIVKSIEPYIDSHQYISDIFDDDPIKTNLGITEDIIIKTIKHGELSTDKKDELTDMGDSSSNYDPLTLEDEYDEYQSFQITLALLGETIKNSEDLDINIKKESFMLFLKGCKVLWINFRKSLLNYAKEVNQHILSKYSGKNMEDELQKAYDLFTDLIRVCIPLALSQFINENAATEKMKSAYKNLLEEYQYDSESKMFLTFLSYDLNLPFFKNALSDYIKYTTNKNYLYTCLFKLLYSFSFNVNRNNDKIVSDIADCYIKITGQNKANKGKIIQNLRERGFYDKLKLQ